MAAHPTVGHVNGLITIGRQLLTSGADVRFAMSWRQPPKLPMPSLISTALSLRANVEQARLRFVPLPADPMMLALAVALPWTSGARELRLAARLMTSGVTDAIAHLEAELDREPADVIRFAAKAKSLASQPPWRQRGRKVDRAGREASPPRAG